MAGVIQRSLHSVAQTIDSVRFSSTMKVWLVITLVSFLSHVNKKTSFGITTATNVRLQARENAFNIHSTILEHYTLLYKKTS